MNGRHAQIRTTIVRSRVQILAELSDRLGLPVVRVQSATSRDSKKAWRVTTVDRIVPRDCSAGKAGGLMHLQNAVIVRSHDCRNPRYLNAWAVRLGRPRTAPPLTAEDGHQIVKLLHAHEEAA